MQSILIIFQKSITFILLITFISSCHLYKISESPLTNQVKIENYLTDHNTSIYNKYIIIHQEGKLFAVEDFRKEDDFYKGKLIPIDTLALEYYERSLIKRNIEISSENKKYSNQLHLHIRDLNISKLNEFQFNSSQIVQIRTLQQNEGAAVASVFGGFISAVLIFSLGITALANL